MLIGILGLLTLGATVYVSLCALLYFGQSGFIFFPRQNDPQLTALYAANRVEIPATDATLEGWWIENPQAATPAVILYFGGNAEDVLYTATLLRHFNAQRMLVVNYRGYGRSSGEPGQEALFADALAVYEHALGAGVRPENIFVMGRSLGSGVAAMLAGSRPVRAAILITPFDSLAAVASTHYPVIPVRLLLQHPFASIEWARRTQAPALLLAAQRDFVVPARHAQRLFEAWPGKKQLHVLEDVGHNDIESHPEYFRLINEFIAAGLPGSTAACRQNSLMHALGICRYPGAQEPAVPVMRKLCSELEIIKTNHDDAVLAYVRKAAAKLPHGAAGCPERDVLVLLNFADETVDLRIPAGALDAFLENGRLQDRLSGEPLPITPATSIHLEPFDARVLQEPCLAASVDTQR